MLFYLLALIVFVGVILVGQARGVSFAAMWVVLPVFLLAPAWLRTTFGSLTLELRSVAAFALILCALGQITQGGKIGFSLLDVFILGMAVSVSLSQWLCGTMGPLTIPDLMRRWVLPYVVGRLLLDKPGDLRKASIVFGCVVAFLGLAALGEMIVGINPWTVVFPHSFALLEEGEGYRHGMKRAHGPTDHPIFLGMILVLCFPFTIESFRLSLKKMAPKFVAWTPFLTMGGIFATISRGPMLAGFMALFSMMFFLSGRFRLPIALGMVVLAGIVYVEKDEALEILAQMGGEAKQEETRIIFIDGEPTEYTGTLHRLLLWRVYDDAIRTTGWFGHGFAMADIQLEEDLALRFGSIDNGYLLLLLQHGWTTVGFFVAMLAWMLLLLGYRAWSGPAEDRMFVSAGWGAVMGVTALLTTVWLSPDFSALLFAWAGWTASLVRIQAEPPTPESGVTPREQSPPPRRRIRTGIAPLPNQEAIQPCRIKFTPNCS